MKKLLAIVISMAMIVAMMPMGVFATVGTEENTNLINAINALSKENHTLVLPEGTTWPEATTVYWKAGDQSGFEANLTTALTNSYKADKGDITIVCKPNADVGPMTHGHVADSITIYGNGAYVSDGECDLEVDTYKFSRSTGAQADNGSYLEKAITITAYELDNLGVWGQRNTNNTINVNLIDCDGKAVEGKNNLQRVYISGKIGKNNITLTDCDFITAATSVYSNAVGTIAINKCSFKNSSAPVNLNNKSGGVQNITIADCTFEDCATTVNSTGWKNFAAPIRIVASENGSTSNVEINNAKISYTGENKNVGNGDVLLGDGRQNEKSAGNINLTVKRTNATIQQQQPGYYDASGSIDANKMNSVNATLDQTVNTDNGNLVVQETPLTDYVIVKGIKGMENHKYISIDSAYAAGNAILAEADNGGLVQNGLSNENFDKLFTDKGNITWTIYGKQNFDETNQPYLLTFGRKAKHYSNEKHIGTITLKGGNNDKIKDIVNFKTNATLNYEWWGEKIPDVMVVDNITMNVQKPDNSSLSFSQAYNDGINLTINNCIVNGGIYFYNNQPNDITFTNNIFNGVNGIQNALFIQGHKTEITKATIIGNTISGYDRAMNLNQDTGVFIVKDNTITPGTGYSAIQVSSCSSATIENNKIILNDKTNVLTIHESFAERNLKASININNNTINIADGAKAYLVYDDINASGKEYGENAANVTLNWGENNISGNFDNTKGIKKETEYAVSEYIKTALKNVIPKPVNPVTPSTPADNVTNNPADKNTTADITPAVKDNKAETTVDAKTADKIVEKALENKSEEIIVDAAGNNTVASSEVGIPE
ncbi:MAG: hypothetical protein MR358_02310, partial [Clostridiales bacterium]|nr:hypothetical protein [Clostridiales bacterium]